MIKSTFISVCLILSLTAASYAGYPSVHNKTDVSEYLKSKPVKFTENKGQIADQQGKPVSNVLFKASSPGTDVYVTTTGLTYVFQKQKKSTHLRDPKLSEINNLLSDTVLVDWDRIEMNLAGAEIKKENIITEGSSSDFSQYFLPQCPQGITDVHSFDRITIKDIYPGIDWVLYNSDKTGFKYDFIVNKGADPSLIKLVYNSLNPLKLKKDGSIEIVSALGTINENAPFSYQGNKTIENHFQLTSVTKNNLGGYNSQVSFTAEDYDKNNILVIDPQLVWCTFFGGNSDDFNGQIAFDQNKNMFITGTTSSTVFPLVSLGAGAYYSGTFAGGSDGFLLKFNPNGQLIWSTYYGGSDGDSFGGICCDPFGNVFVSGGTASFDFPLFNPGGGAYFQTVIGVLPGFSIGDIVILKFDTSGHRLWATGFNGSQSDAAGGLCSDQAGNIFMVGSTASHDIPLLNPGGGAYFQSTWSGTFGDILILKFSNSCSLLWSTLYGGIDEDYASSIAIDQSGSIFIGGATYSPNFPLFNPGGGAYFQGTYLGGTLGSLAGSDAFILKFSNSCNRLWATYYGGNHGDAISDLKVDSYGNLVAIGTTTSTNFPVYNPGTPAFFHGTASGWEDGFILKFKNNTTRSWATYYGGDGVDRFFSLSIDKCNNLYITGDVQNSSTLNMVPDCNGGYFDNVMGPINIYKSLLLKFNNNKSLSWSTFFTFGTFFGTIDPDNNLYVTGYLYPGLSAPLPFINPGGGAYFDVTETGYDLVIQKFKMHQPTPASAMSVASSGCSCFGKAKLSATTVCSSLQYQWNTSSGTLISNNDSISGLCAGTYKGIIIDSLTCYSDTLTAVITPSAISATCNTLITPCGTSNTGALNVSTSGGVPLYSYSWMPTGGTNSVAANLSAGTYSVIVSDSSGCRDTVSVTLPSLPVPSAFISGTDTICQGESINLSATDGINYTWNTGDTAQTIMVTPLFDTNYTLIVSNGYCSDTSSLTITVNPLPIINLTSDATIILGDSIQLSSTPATSYSWSPINQLSCNDCQAPYASPTETTNYCIAVTNNYGCISNACELITVYIPNTLFIPNAFTPDGNGLNDVFKPELVGAHDYHFLIFNRWGEKIFETSDIQKGWNGFYNEQLCEQDVYVYKINYVDDIKKQQHQNIGNFSLIK